MTVVGLALSVGAPLAAHAETVVVHDKGGDVWKVWEDGDQEKLVRAPHQDRGDLRRLRVAHGDRAINLRTKFVDLRRAGLGFAFDVRLRTNAELWRLTGVSGGPKEVLGEPLWRGVSGLERRNGSDVRCAVTHKVDYATNVIRLTIPRSCLKNPRWIQVKATYVSMNRGPVGTMFVDSAHDDRPRIKSWTKRIRRG